MTNREGIQPGPILTRIPAPHGRPSDRDCGRSRVARLRAQGLGWKTIAREMKLGVGTVLRAAQQVAKPSSEDPDETVFAN